MPMTAQASCHVSFCYTIINIKIQLNYAKHTPPTHFHNIQSECGRAANNYLKYLGAFPLSPLCGVSCFTFLITEGNYQPNWLCLL